MNEFNTPEKIAAYGGGGLIVLGVVVIGLLEILLGSPHPVTGEGQIVHEALVPIGVRSVMILLGLITWAGYGVYKVVGTSPGSGAA
jgi:hypothetical protein